ncbi:DUF397 domain-containing protein [Streptomyces aidingensis]|nr:DUF397 domain-containing protein [Streptomyces aidingensis]
MITGSDPADARWRASSYSNAGGECVEVARHATRGRIAVRDSKEPGGALLVFAAEGFAAFVGALRAGRC